MDRFQEAVTALSLPKDVELVPPRDFEGDRWQIRLTFSSSGELAKGVKTAERLARSGGAGEGSASLRIFPFPDRRSMTISVKPPGKILVEAALAETELVRHLRDTLPHADFRWWIVFPIVRHRTPKSWKWSSFGDGFSSPALGHAITIAVATKSSTSESNVPWAVPTAFSKRTSISPTSGFLEIGKTCSRNSIRNFGGSLGFSTGSERGNSRIRSCWIRGRVFSKAGAPFCPATQRRARAQNQDEPCGKPAGTRPRRRTIVAWSLNSPFIRGHEEPRTASLRARLEAAQSCARWGYYLAFHFDPLVEYPHWRKGYARILDRLFESVDTERIVWISLGCFRFMPRLRSTLLSRRPKSRLLLGEFIRGPDDKMRYFRDIRVEMYSFLVERIRGVDPGLCVYLCMEGGDIWREVFGFTQKKKGACPRSWSRAVLDRMGLDPGFCGKNP